MGRFRKRDLLESKNPIYSIRTSTLAYRIAKAVKPHRLAEEVIASGVVDTADIIFEDDAARKLEQVALSNDTVRKRINGLSIDIRYQLISNFKASLKT